MLQVDWEFWTNSNDQCGTTCDTQQAFIRVTAISYNLVILPLLVHADEIWHGSFPVGLSCYQCTHSKTERVHVRISS